MNANRSTVSVPPEMVAESVDVRLSSPSTAPGAVSADRQPQRAVQCRLVRSSPVFSRRFRRADIRFKANRSIDLLEARREKDFLLRSLTNPDFYRTGSTSYPVLYREAMISLRRKSTTIRHASRHPGQRSRQASRGGPTMTRTMRFGAYRRAVSDGDSKELRRAGYSVAHAGREYHPQQSFSSFARMSRISYDMANSRLRSTSRVHWIDKLVRTIVSLLAHVDHYQQDLEAYRCIQEELDCTRTRAHGQIS